MVNGHLFLSGRQHQPARRIDKLTLGDTRGMDEEWLRSLLFAHPEMIPIADIDPSFGPLQPLCRELPTEAGPVDLAFINPEGKLTLVECKLWHRPNDRRNAVGQVLDIARAISLWSHADLLRRVAEANGRADGQNLLMRDGELAAGVTRHLRSGRFLLLCVGDGIVEYRRVMTELINHNAAAGLAFGLVEVAIYDLDGAGLAIQPRVVAGTM
jgi:hypothetical protein